jgi:hypothetical protein
VTGDWPPDWQAARLQSLIARELRLGAILVELDELGDLVGDDPGLAGEVRVLAARLRTRRNDWRDLVRSYQAGLEETAEA